MYLYPTDFRRGTSNDRIIANVSAYKIMGVMQYSICSQDEPIYLILELPSAFSDENETAPGVTDVYYTECLDTDHALTVLIRAGDIMINDGLFSFGFGCHGSHDEIMFGKYNVTCTYSEDIDRCIDFYAARGIPQTDKLVTAWDLFTVHDTGSSVRIVTDGTDAYAIPDMLREWGMRSRELTEFSEVING